MKYHTITHTHTFSVTTQRRSEHKKQRTHELREYVTKRPKRTATAEKWQISFQFAYGICTPFQFQLYVIGDGGSVCIASHLTRNVGVCGNQIKQNVLTAVIIHKIIVLGYRSVVKTNNIFWQLLVKHLGFNGGDHHRWKWFDKQINNCQTKTHWWCSPQLRPKGLAKVLTARLQLHITKQ